MHDASTAPPAPPRSAIVLAFLAVYILWGSTYLAIRVAVDTLPPLGMAATRFLVAGGLLALWTVIRGEFQSPSLVHWRSALIVGALLLFGGNGSVVLAETRVDSGVAALVIATTPLWMITIHALMPGGTRPRKAEIAGLVLGFAGVFVLVDPSVGRAVDPIGTVLLVLATISWASGSLYSRVATLPKSPLLAAAIEMLAGGAVLLVASLFRGEWASVDPARFSWASITALVYLIVAGSLLGFSAYIWLLRVSTPAKVATYAYVNPVVAVLLGWAVLDEPITTDTYLATALIVAAVVLTTLVRRSRS
jgi:drug/metabolite transporter (DMT)-like permease